MKRVLCFLVFAVYAICLTGCMRMNTTITVKSNGKMDVDLLFASMDMSDFSGGGSTSGGLTQEQKEAYEKEGWSVEEYASDGYLGFVISKKNVDLNDINTTMKQTSENTNQGGAFNIKREGLKYTLKWQIYDESNKSSMSQAAPYFEKAGGYMKFTLNLPVKPISSNATSVSDDGKTLEWDLLKLDETGSIEASYYLINVPLILQPLLLLLCLVKRRKQNYSHQLITKTYIQ